jgi:hypothetical protein
VEKRTERKVGEKTKAKKGRDGGAGRRKREEEVERAREANGGGRSRE